MSSIEEQPKYSSSHGHTNSESPISFATLVPDIQYYIDVDEGHLLYIHVTVDKLEEYLAGADKIVDRKTGDVYVLTGYKICESLADHPCLEYITEDQEAEILSGSFAMLVLVKHRDHTDAWKNSVDPCPEMLRIYNIVRFGCEQALCMDLSFIDLRTTKHPVTLTGYLHKDKFLEDPQERTTLSESIPVYWTTMDGDTVYVSPYSALMVKGFFNMDDTIGGVLSVALCEIIRKKLGADVTDAITKDVPLRKELVERVYATEHTLTPGIRRSPAEVLAVYRLQKYINDFMSQTPERQALTSQ